MDSMAMARGLLMLMPSPLLIPTTMVDTLDMVWVTMVATVLDTMAWDTMARGLLMLMPNPLLIPTYGGYYGHGLGYYGHGYGLGYRGYHW